MSRSRIPFSRRTLLQGLGLSAAAVGLPSILSSGANAQDDGPPLRIVIFYEPHGYTQRMARPRAPGQGDWGGGAATLPGESLGSWELAPSFAPLAGYESRMINLVGMDMLSAKLPSATGDGGGHGHHQTNALTSSPRIQHNVPGGASIDQHIADGLIANGVTTLVPSVAIRYGDIGGGGGSPVYRPDGTSVPRLYQPCNVYDRLFPEEIRASDEEQEARSRTRLATGNLVRSLGSSLVRRLPAEQRARAEAHMQLHSDLQTRLGLRVAGEIPDRSVLGAWSDPLRYVNGSAYDILGMTPLQVHNMTRDVNIGLVAAALHADITRVAVVSGGWLPGEAWGFSGGDEESGVEGSFGSLNNHGFQHEAQVSMALGARGEEYITAYHQATTRSLRYLLDTLAGLPEGDGSSLLDNTIVLNATEMADPRHQGTQLNWQVFGSAHGQFRTGRTLAMDRVQDADNERRSVKPFVEWGAQPESTVQYHQEGPGHGQLFATLATAMGVETEVFGDPSVCPGPIDLS